MDEIEQLLNSTNAKSNPAKRGFNPGEFEDLASIILESNMGRVAGLRYYFKRSFAKDLDINAQNIDGTTLLLVACRRGKVNIIKYLLRVGADPRITDGKRSAFYSALLDQNTHVIVGDILAYYENLEATLPADVVELARNYQDLTGNGFSQYLCQKIISYNTKYPSKDDNSLILNAMTGNSVSASSNASSLLFEQQSKQKDLELQQKEQALQKQAQELKKLAEEIAELKKLSLALHGSNDVYSLQPQTPGQQPVGYMPFYANRSASTQTTSRSSSTEPGFNPAKKLKLGD